MQDLGVRLEELPQQSLDGDEVDRSRIEKVEIDIDEAGLLVVN